jgi:hypothetical protein
VKYALAACRQVAEVEKAGDATRKQRGLGHDADLRPLELEGRGVEHVCRQVDGIVVDAEGRQIGEVGGQRRVVHRGVERIEAPRIGGVSRRRDGNQEKRGEG